MVPSRSSSQDRAFAISRATRFRGGGEIQPQTTYAVGSTPYSIATGDLNGDGRLDLVTANYGPGSVSILLGNGNGTFQPQTTYAAGTQPHSVAIADFNGDGRLDLVTANNDVNSISVSVLLGNGNGTFQPPIGYAAGSYAYSVAVGDLNSDGKPDLAVVHILPQRGPGTENTVSVLLGNGDGTFQPQATHAFDSTYWVAIGDLNGDGKPDLVGAGGDVQVLLGNGNGTFQPPATYPIASRWAVSVAIADLNGDGRSDLVTANASSTVAPGSVSVLLSDGSGAFQSPTTYAAGASNTIAVGDLNGDGRPDLLVADGSVLVLLGNGNGAFQPPTGYAAGTGPVAVAIADLDGDGRPDLTTTNVVDNSVSVLLNGPPALAGPTYTIVKTPLSAPSITTYNSATGIVGGSAEPSSIVRLSDGPALLGQANVSGSGIWSISTDALANGDHKLTAIATVAGALQSQPSEVLSVNRTAAGDDIAGTPDTHTITAGPGNDTLTGNLGDDTLDGGFGTDLMRGLSGNDILMGGLGVDTAAFSGALDQYSVRTGLGSDGVLHTIVADLGGVAADGIDDLVSVEKLQFTDRTITLHGAQQNHQSSVDGDRFDDVLIQNSSTGHVYYAKMAAGAFQSWGIVTGTLGGYDWQAIAMGDVNPGSPGGAETFVQQQSTGTIYYASLDTGATTWGVVSTALTPDWKLRSVVDINGDGSVDAIVQNQTTGTIYYADMRGGAFRTWGVVNANLTSDWKAVGAGDINGDGFADVVIQSQITGTTYWADMAGGAFHGWGVVTANVTADWQAKTVADLTGDGFADVVLQNQQTGTAYYADMKNGAFDHWGVAVPNVDASWVVQGAADVDADGRTDVLVQHTSDGTTYYAHMGDNGFAGWGAVATNITAEWQVV